MSSLPVRIDEFNVSELEPGAYLPLRPWVLTLPGGETLVWQLPVIKGRRPGRTVLLLAGAHGDDYESTAAVRGLVDRLARRPLDDFAGCVVALPLYNPPAFTAGTRVDPFAGTDASVGFAGDGAGAGAPAQLAERFGDVLLPQADLVIELFDEPAEMEALPTVGWVHTGDAAAASGETAAALGLSARCPVGAAPGRLTSVCAQRKTPAVWVRLGGGGRVRPSVVAGTVDGLENALVHVGVLPGQARTCAVEFHLDGKAGDEHHRTPAGGMFEPDVAVGSRIERGGRLGRVVDPCGAVQFESLSRVDGVVTSVRVCPRVIPGDTVATAARTSG